MRNWLVLAAGLATAMMAGLAPAAAAPTQYWSQTDNAWVTYDPQAQQMAGYTSYTPIPREDVAYAGPYGPNTIIVNTSERRLYFVYAPGRALKYGVGVGREGFTWAGTDRVSRKAEWPGWTPPPQMIARERAKGHILPAHMPGGINNPLGARALYIGARLYRIHGTAEPWTIGQAVSSGCIRMTNEDVTDLYDRVPVGAKVVVLR
jgi:lipoprotein-anchoring transpeptidase ErfK/SrfK